MSKQYTTHPKHTRILHSLQLSCFLQHRSLLFLLTLLLPPNLGHPSHNPFGIQTVMTKISIINLKPEHLILFQILLLLFLSLQKTINLQIHPQTS